MRFKGAAIIAIALISGCGSRSGAIEATGIGADRGTGTAGVQAQRAADRASHWTLPDLEAAEGRTLKAQTQNGDTMVTAEMTGAEKATLSKIMALPPGDALKDADFDGEHLTRVKMHGEFVFGLDANFRRSAWRYDDAKGRLMGYRVHSQPRDLISGKYIVAFYGPNAKLLMAQPLWY